MEVERAADVNGAGGEAVERSSNGGAIARRASTGAAAGGTQSKLSQFVVCGNLFEVDHKYVPIKPIGKGAYGVVWRVKTVPIFSILIMQVVYMC